jgi:hypothetical protein
MNKLIKLIATLGAFAVLALFVYISGELAMSNSPILALAPVAVVLFVIVLFIRRSDKPD